jgi:hypothetical protein
VGLLFRRLGFKKVYTHPLKKRPAFGGGSPEHLIVSDATKDFAACERITHSHHDAAVGDEALHGQGHLPGGRAGAADAEPNQVDEQIASSKASRCAKDRPEDQPYTLWEIQCELDLEEFAPKPVQGQGRAAAVSRDHGQGFQKSSRCGATGSRRTRTAPASGCT